MTKLISDEEFITAFKRYGSPREMSKALGMSERGIYARRRNIEEKMGVFLSAHQNVHAPSARAKIALDKVGHRKLIKIKDGLVVIFSDAHFWPGERSAAYEALLRFLKKYKKRIKLIVCNGDAFDGARISRHNPAGWEDTPEVADELSYCVEAMRNIENLAPDGVPLVWTMGNHDTRFSARLAQMAPEYVRIHGTDLPDHFPAWDFCWSLEINTNVMVKHRWHNGVHGTYNNVLKGGRSVYTGHCHRLCVTPYSDWNGRRYGTDTGTLSDFGPHVKKFAYGEDNPYNWASGFAVASFDEKGNHLPPSLVTVIDGKAYFNGEEI